MYTWSPCVHQELLCTHLYQNTGQSIISGTCGAHRKYMYVQAWCQYIVGKDEICADSAQMSGFTINLMVKELSGWGYLNNT